MLLRRGTKFIKKASRMRGFFGSWANGKFKKFSDIDILYQETSHEIPTSKISTLITFLEESNFSYKVDLVNDKQLAKSYRENVEEQKIEL